jgi:hypothetical protein
VYGRGIGRGRHTTLAEAILDRVIHNARRLQLRGDSLRKKAVQTIAA